MTFKIFFLFVTFVIANFIIYNIFFKSWISVLDLRAYETLIVGSIILGLYFFIQFKNKK